MVRILVAEDDNIMQLHFARYFRGAPVEIIFAGDGKEALDLLRKETFAFIVSDVDMPCMDGPALLRRVWEEFPLLVPKFVFYASTDPGVLPCFVRHFDKSEIKQLRAHIHEVLAV